MCRLEVGEAADEEQRDRVVNLSPLPWAAVWCVDIVGRADGVPWIWLWWAGSAG